MGLSVDEEEGYVVPCKTLFQAGAGTIFGVNERQKRRYLKVEVPLDRIHYTQYGISVVGLRKKVERQDTELPQIVLSNEKLNVLSGHTRIGANIVMGGRTMEVALYQWEDRIKDYLPKNQFRLPPYIRLKSK